ncbi:MAG: ABC transporter permease, partial [Candidatus Sumerlaeota bacterium]
MTNRTEKRDHGLRDYVIRRLMLMIPTFLGTTLVVFVLCQAVPGGPIDQLRLRMLTGGGGSGEAGGGGTRNTATNTPVSEEQLKNLNDYYGFSDPIPTRYVKYMKNLVTLDFGNSFRYSEPAIELIRRRLPIS